MKKRLIAILFGGEGSENDVSRLGARSILSAIDRERYIPYPVYIDRLGRWREKNGRGRILRPARLGRRAALLSPSGEVIRPDVTFPILHGDFGEDGRIQGLLDALGFCYVGCSVSAGAVASDKILTKRVAEALGIPTVPSVALLHSDGIERQRRLAEGSVGYPMFIKPSCLGSSIGCSLVTSPCDFEGAAGLALRCGRALAEEFLEGARELECGYLDSPTYGEVFTLPGEVGAHGVYTYEKKYGTRIGALISPVASVSEEYGERIRSYSAALVREMGIRQLARLDYFLYEKEIYLNEINTMPGFTEKSLYPLMMRECGIGMTELITELIEGAYDRDLR
ncbi:MAG: D-alanine--D-alanine ligase [Clostridia bacterium]|nr:D-alanine--D-alanine ligase [Clostridia bacterium]